MDFIANGQAQGSVAEILLNHGGDTGALRPFIGSDGKSYITTLNAAGKPEVHRVNNAAASLRKDDWIQIDTAVRKAARDRLQLVDDLVGKGLTYRLDGMGVSILQTETQSEKRDASIDMDALSPTNRDRPEFDLTNLPLPIIHDGFDFSLRNLSASRRGGSPLDTTMAEMCSRKVAEKAEKLAVGVLATNYGGGKVYGITNFPDRLTQVLTDPTSSGWTPQVLLTEILAMRKKARVAKHYGPYRLYVSSDWDEYLDRDWSANKGEGTVRERLSKIDKIEMITELDYLSGFQVVLIQMTSDVIREVIGLNLTTLQWPEMGGLRTHFKVMTIMTPQLRADYYGNCGIVHGNVA